MAIQMIQQYKEQSKEKRKHSGLLYQEQLLSGQHMFIKLAAYAVNALGKAMMPCEAWRLLSHPKVLCLWSRHAAEVQATCD